MDQEHVQDIDEFANGGVSEGQSKEQLQNQQKTEDFLESESVQEDWPHGSGETITDSSERSYDCEETIIEVFFTNVFVVSVDKQTDTKRKDSNDNGHGKTNRCQRDTSSWSTTLREIFSISSVIRLLH